MHTPRSGLIQGPAGEVSESAFEGRDMRLSNAPDNGEMEGIGHG